MRVSFIQRNASLIQDIGKKTEEITNLSYNVSSGNKMQSPSDDPFAWAQSMDMQQQLSEYDTFNTNMDFATGWNQMTESSLSGVIDLTVRAKEIGISAGSVGGTPAQTANVEELNQMINEAMNTANSQYQDRYLFGGMKQLGNTPPFSMDASGNVTYSGDAGQLTVRTGKGANNTQVANLAGDDAFNFTRTDGTTGNVMSELWNLKNAIQNNNSAAITTSLGNLDAARLHLTDRESLVGIRLTTLQNQQSALQSLSATQKTILSGVKDADYAEVISQLQLKQTAYQASLQVTSMLSNLNLTKYLS